MQISNSIIHIDVHWQPLDCKAVANKTQNHHFSFPCSLLASHLPNTFTLQRYRQVALFTSKQFRYFFASYTKWIPITFRCLACCSVLTILIHWLVQINIPMMGTGLRQTVFLEPIVQIGVFCPKVKYVLYKVYSMSVPCWKNFNVKMKFEIQARYVPFSQFHFSLLLFYFITLLQIPFVKKRILCSSKIFQVASFLALGLQHWR